MKLFVTGSRGYIGRNFIKYAIKKKHMVYAVTRKKENKKVKNIKWLVGNIDRDWKELKAADILIHFASVGVLNKKNNYKKSLEFNVFKSTQLILNALKYNCKNWIIISTIKEKKIKHLIKTNKSKYDEQNLNYIITKYLFSNICKEISSFSNINCRILKLSHVYGGDEPAHRLWPNLKKNSKTNKNFKMTSGKQLLNFSHIDDVVSGIFECCNFKKKNKIFPQEWELASGKSIPVKNFAEKIWKNNNAKGKIFFSKSKDFDKNNYPINKKRLWKIKSRKFE